MMLKRLLVPLFALILMQGAAQQMLDNFGKNRIQYQSFKWSYISSANFDVFFYDGRRRLATDVTEYLENEFDRITDLIGYPPYLKTKVFLYNSVSDLQQSNVGLNRNPYVMGGETDFVKPYVEIAHPGTLEGFKEELIFKVTDLLVHEMMFGGSLKDMFQNAVLLNLPEWFIRGVSLYAAHGWNEEMDDFARQLVRSRKASRPTSLTGNEAALFGHSFWNFIVEKYGRGSMSNILNYSRVIRNEQRSVVITLGISFRQLMVEWKNFYAINEKQVSDHYVAVSDSNRFTPKHRSTTVYPTMKISPDGKNLAYAENDRGKFRVMVKSFDNEKETTIVSGGNTVLRQTVDYREPLISWADENTLGVIGKEKGNYIFWLYDLKTKSKIPRRLDKFSNIRNFDFSANGRLAVLSADQDGQNDLFLIATRRDRIRRMTNDLYDDLDPSFIPGTNAVVFSSNRVNDTINSKKTGLQQIGTSLYNLFIYELDTTKNVVHRLTNTLSKDFHPIAVNDNLYYYLSDQRGITNIFRFDRRTSIYTQVSNFAAGIRTFDLHQATRKLAFTSTRKLSEDIFLLYNFDAGRQVFTPTSRRKELLQARTLNERRKKQPEQKGLSLKELMELRLQEFRKDSVRTDSVVRVQPAPVPRDTSRAAAPQAIDTDDYQFDMPVEKTLIPQVLRKDTVIATPVPPQEKKTINTSDYVFEDEAVKKTPVETLISKYIKPTAQSRIQGPFPYLPKFSYENLVTNFVIDQLRGFSVKMETQMNDMLENYRIYGGIQTAFDGRNGDVFAEFQFLPKRFDLSARFDRKVIFWNRPESNLEEKYSLQKIELGFSLPLSVRLRASIKPFVAYTRFVDRGEQLPTGPGGPEFRPSVQQGYLGSKAELVFDNSLTTGLNIIEGTRGKLSAITYQGLGKSSASFSQLSLDFRHYQKIYREIVFAVRGYTGTFFGASPKKYLLGGMDNWLGNRINYDGLNNPLYTTADYNSNLLFVEFASNLRGFDYATLYGTSVAVANAELRVPLVRALTGGPIASNFFRNMQLTAFYDIGSSWSGKPPFTATESVRSRIVPSSTTGSPFVVRIDEYLNPWLYSYGFGFRSMIFGYYLKFDLAWPVENYQVNNPRLHITLGFDF